VLDVETGTVRWRHAGRDIAGVSTTPAVAGDAVLAARVPGWLDAYALDDGETRWHVPLDDAWPVALTVGDGTAFVRTSSGTVTAHDVDTGDARWSRALGGGARAGRPYSRALAGARRPLVVAGDRVWTAGFDTLVALDAATGAVVTETAAGAEVATVVVRGTEVVGVTVDAQLVAATS
jgi:outer membrane protein assembly factor BamB